MKKRSLFAAVAMLIVSAIVLTSATYAWFAASSNATVSRIGASVTNADGNLLVKATGTYAKSTADWGTNVADTDYEDLPDALVPVSFNFTNAGLIDTTNGPIKVAYDGDKFSAGTLAPTSGASYDKSKIEYQHYSFDVKYSTNNTDTAKKVTLTPSINRGGDDFVYIYVEVACYNKTTDTTTTNGYLYANGDSYCPVLQAIGSGTTLTDVKVVPSGSPEGTEASNNGIIDRASDNVSGGQSVNAYVNETANAISAIDSSSITPIEVMSNMKATSTPGANEGDPATITECTHTSSVNVYVWAEGNDSDCVGTVNVANAGVSFSLGASNQA